MIQLNDKIILVTGANGGLGTTMTGTFLAADATVVGVAKADENWVHLSKE